MNTETKAFDMTSIAKQLNVQTKPSRYLYQVSTAKGTLKAIGNTYPTSNVIPPMKILFIVMITDKADGATKFPMHKIVNNLQINNNKL